MKLQQYKKGVALIVSMVMMFSILPLHVFATPTIDENSETVIDVAPIDQDASVEQDMPKEVEPKPITAAGGKIYMWLSSDSDTGKEVLYERNFNKQDPITEGQLLEGFPKKLSVLTYETVMSGSSDFEEIDFTWECDVDFSTHTSSDTSFIYKAVPQDGYTWYTGVTVPTITVTVSNTIYGFGYNNDYLDSHFIIAVNGSGKVSFEMPQTLKHKNSPTLNYDHYPEINISTWDWTLKSTTSNKTTGSSYKQFTVDYPAGEYIYELQLKDGWSLANDTVELPLKKVIYAGADGGVPTYTITGTPTLDINSEHLDYVEHTYHAYNTYVENYPLNSQLYEKHAEDGYLPPFLRFNVTNNITSGTKTIEVPITWEVQGDEYAPNAGKPSSGENWWDYKPAVPAVVMPVGEYKYTAILPTEYNRFQLENDGSDFETTIHVKDSSFIIDDSNEFLPRTLVVDQYDIMEENVFEFTLEGDISMEGNSVNPYYGGRVDVSSPAIDTSVAGTFEVPYDIDKISSMRNIFQANYNGFIDARTIIHSKTKSNGDPMVVAPTITVTVNPKTYADGQFVKWAYDILNQVGGYHHEAVLMKGDELDFLQFDPTMPMKYYTFDDANKKLVEKSIEVAIKQESGRWVGNPDTGGYWEYYYDKDYAWLNEAGINMDNWHESNMNTIGATATFTPTYVGDARMGTLPDGIVMPEITITIVGSGSDEVSAIYPAFGSGTEMDPYIYYMQKGQVGQLYTPKDGTNELIGIDEVKNTESLTKYTYWGGHSRNVSIDSDTDVIIANTAGSDPIIFDSAPVETNKYKGRDACAWVYVIDPLMTPLNPEGYDQGSNVTEMLDKAHHELDATKSATWSDGGIEEAEIIFDINAIEPSNADIIFMIDISRSMTDSWGALENGLRQTASYIFQEGNAGNNRIAVVPYANDTTGAFNFVNNYASYQQAVSGIMKNKPDYTDYSAHVPALVHANSFAKLREPSSVDRPLYLFYLSDGGNNDYMDDEPNHYTPNQKATKDNALNSLEDIEGSVRTSVTLGGQSGFVQEFASNPSLVFEQDRGDATANYVQMMQTTIGGIHNVIITDEINENWTVNQAKLDSLGLQHGVEPTVATDSSGTQTVTINAGNLPYGVKHSYIIPITIKEASKPTGGKTVTYPTNASAEIDYKNSLFVEKKLTDDSTITPAPDTIEKPTLSLPSDPSNTAYKVIYDANGGTGVTEDTKQYKQGDLVTVKQNGFTYAGKHFMSWNTASDGSGTSYNPLSHATNTLRMGTANVTLYAQWREDRPTPPVGGTTYTVTYKDGVNETVFEDNIHSHIASGSQTPQFSEGTPIRSGYTFIGWDPIVAENVTKDAIYTAQWRKNSTDVEKTYYQIEIQVEGSGIVNPDGGDDSKVQVEKGHNQKFTMTPSEGWYVVDVLVDGVSVGALTSYEFENVQKDYRIKVIFKEIADPSDPTDLTDPEIGIPSTGDATNVMMWITLALLSGLLLFVGYKKNVRNKKS